MSDYAALGVIAVLALLVTFGAGIAQWLGVYFAAKRNPASYTSFMVAGGLYVLMSLIMWMSVGVALSAFGVSAPFLHFVMLILTVKTAWMLWAAFDAKKLVPVADEKTRMQRVYIGYGVAAASVIFEAISASANPLQQGAITPYFLALAGGLTLAAIAGILYQANNAWTLAFPLLCAALVLQVLPLDGVDASWVGSLVVSGIIAAVILPAVYARQQEDKGIASAGLYAPPQGMPGAMSGYAPQSLPMQPYGEQPYQSTPAQSPYQGAGYQADPSQAYVAQPYQAAPVQQPNAAGYPQAPQEYATPAAPAPAQPQAPQYYDGQHYPAAPVQQPYAEGYPQGQQQYGAPADPATQYPQQYPGQQNPQTWTPQQ